MKIKTQLSEVVFIVSLISLWLICPLLFIKLNDYLGWPIINFLLFKIIGLVLIILSVLTYLYLFGLFAKIGHGTPIPLAPTRKLIATGLYAKTRNPMYITHFALAIGLFLFFGKLALLMGAFLEILGFHLFVVLWEEPNLKKRLGSSYEEYLIKVPRWL